MGKLICQTVSLLLLFLSNISLVFSDNSFEQSYTLGIKYFKQAMYSDAESAFSQSIGYKARLGQAVSAFHLEQTSKALSLFKQSVLLANSDEERYISLYNAAACSFISGDYSLATQLFKDADKYQPDNEKILQLIKASDYLAKMVLAQLARDQAKSNKKKSSEGKKTIPALEFVFDDDINLRIEDDESSNTETSSHLLQLQSDKKLLNSLISSGIESVRIKQEGTDVNIPSIIDLDIIYEFSNIESASYTPAVSQPDLWKRIFELEAGFPASLENPEKKPGVRTW